MLMELVYNVDAALVTIDGSDGGAGFDPRSDSRFDSPYEKFRGAYAQAREAERTADAARVRGITPPVVSPKLWETVIDLGTAILTGVGKDLEVAARMTEALARLHGMAGIRDGLRLSANLAEQFWDHLFPALDPVEGPEERVSLLSGLNGANKPGVLVERINFQRVTEGTTERDYYLWEYSIAADTHRISDEQAREDRCRQLGYSLDDILKAANSTSGEYFLNLKQEIEAAEAALQDFDQIFDKHCGQLSPPTSQIRGALEKARAAIQRLGQQKMGALLSNHEVTQQPVTPSIAKASSNSSVETTLLASTNGDAFPLSKAALNSRQDAIDAMEMVAKYFRATEPHSPISYSLDKLVKWANLPLDKLILEWIPDSSARDLFGLMTGVVARDYED